MKVRAAVAADTPRLVQLADRFSDEALPAWRRPGSMSSSLDEHKAALASELPEDQTLLVCVTDHNLPVGYAYAMMDKDFFTGELQGHLLFLVTEAEHQRKGVARTLMAAVEEWAQARGATGLLLYVFATNEGARQVYHRLGFQEDMLKMVKPMRGGEDG